MSLTLFDQNATLFRINANKTRIWKLSEMDAAHVSAWSKGGATTIDNFEMLCKTHNRAKGNKQELFGRINYVIFFIKKVTRSNFKGDCKRKENL